METAPASGGAGTLTISAARDCTWAASNGAAWVVITSSANGQGEGSLAYRVAANSEPVMRRATIDVNTAVAAIVQEPAECRFTVTPPSPTIAASGGTVTIQVQASAHCPWTATTQANWLRITAGATGTGDGSVALTVDANSGTDRNATVLVAGATVAVTQNSGLPSAPQPPAPPPPPPPPSPQGCSYAIQPNGQTVGATGGNGTIDVTTNTSTCAWTAVSNTAWITITNGASGTGSGRVTFTASANPGASRTGTISVAGHTFTLSQAGVSCSYSINPSSSAINPGGGQATVTVSAGASCAWTSAAHVSWITFASGASGTGAGTVKLNVAPNPGAARTGTATIAAQTFTVTQAAAACTYVLSPSSIDVPPGGGDRAATVTVAGSGCAWTAAANVSWITIVSGASGTVSGTVAFNVGANGGAARSGTVTIGGQTLTVTQQAVPCTFVITPTSQTVVSGGVADTVSVTTGGSCGWTAATNNPEWLTITGGNAGTGNGAVMFSVGANAGPQRTGTLTIAGQTFTVTQEAPPCTYSIAPSSQTIGAAETAGAVTVTAGGSCPWTAVSQNGDWLTVTGGSSGGGSGQVSFIASANTTGADRTGTIVIAGFSFTLTQTAQ
jgi:hypothetical protein